jgi:hypothetical protein
MQRVTRKVSDPLFGGWSGVTYAPACRLVSMTRLAIFILFVLLQVLRRAFSGIQILQAGGS